MKIRKKFIFQFIFSLFIFVLVLTSCGDESSNSYSIKYNGIDDAINPNTAISYTENDNIELKPAIKKGYDFIGWNDGNQNVDNIKEGSSGDITLTALWEIHQYSIYYANTDGLINPNKTTYTIEDNNIQLEDVEKEGFSFIGWTYNGNKITEIDTNIAQDITVVANFSDHYCHIELEWDLSKENRSYYLNEPFATNFYLIGKNVKLTPKVYLVYGIELEKLEVPYNSGNYLTVSGFDSKTVGIKHVTIDVHGIINQNTKDTYFATTSYDVEVKDYDHDYYGYDIEPENVIVNCPNGYELSAKAKNEDLVASYNWMTSNERLDHEDACSEQSYKPYECFKGSSAFTNKLIVPNTSYDYEIEVYRLLTIYEDMTRVYTKEIVVQTIESDTPIDDTLKLGEYILTVGEEFDLSDYNLGTGKISFNKLGKDFDGYNIVEFVFDNVNYSNSYVSDALRASVGIEYIYRTSEKTHYKLRLIGSNTIINPYYYQEATGISFNFQHLGDEEENNGDLIITGSGSLNFVGGTPALYAECPLIIDTEVSFNSYLGRMCNGINANAILLTENAYVHGTNSGTGMLAMRGNILIDDGALVDLKLSMPRIKGTVANLTAINAAQDIWISKADIYISAYAIPDVYEKFEGIDSCVLINAGGTLTLDEANVKLFVYASNSPTTIPVFDTAVGINSNIIYIQNNTNIEIDMQADLFNSCYAIYGGGIDIEDSKINIKQSCITGLNGIYCFGGNTNITNSNINIYGRKSFVSDGLTFGLFINRNFSFENSKIIIDYNKGIAIASYMGRKPYPSYYEDDYEAIRLTDIILANNQSYGEISVMAYDEEGMFDTFETIYDKEDTNFPTTYLNFDNIE